jgi:hypothetical protein
MKLWFAVIALLSFIGLAQAQTPTARIGDGSVYRVDATSLDIVIQDQTPKEYPQVGHQAPVTFEQTLRQWAAQRFQLTGNSVNALRITLKEGRITERILPIEKGIRGWFKKEESLGYDGALSFEIAIVDANGAVVSKAEASATMSRTLIEGATRADREAVWADIINTAFTNADRELKPRIAEYMSRYIN